MSRIIDVSQIIWALKTLIELGAPDEKGMHPLSAEAILKDIEEQPTLNAYEWHDIRKNPNDLPEKLKDVIVSDIETHGTYSGYYCGDGYWYTDTGTRNDRITEWTPFPEPYKEVEK